MEPCSLAPYALELCSVEPCAFNLLNADLLSAGLCIAAPSLHLKRFVLPYLNFVVSRIRARAFAPLPSCSLVTITPPRPPYSR